MFYPNTYINFTQAGEYTKHYYNGTERIVSRLGEQQVPVSVENEQELEAYKQDVKQIIYNAIGQHLYDEPTDMQEGDVIPLEFLQPCGNNNAVYYYHPNHLSSTMYVTDAQQSVVQSFLYAPYGEIISEYNTHVMGEAFPKYSFNAKELDEETGFYYYEARYYNPPTFISRDPLMSEKPWLTPYHYCSNNPVGRIDPTGCEDWEPEITKDGKVNYVAEKGDNMTTFRKQYGLDAKTAGTILGRSGITKDEQIVAGKTSISGETVKSVTGSEVLKLDWNSASATSQRKVYHIGFALLYENLYGKGYFTLNDYILNMPQSTGSQSNINFHGNLKIPIKGGGYTYNQLKYLRIWKNYTL